MQHPLARRSHGAPVAHTHRRSYIEDGTAMIASPHKVYGPESNDLALQLCKGGKGKVILTDMSANLCVEAHLRDLLEQGFEVTVVKDATAAAKPPELGDGHAIALTNYGFSANAVITTAGVVKAMEAGGTASS